VAHPYWPLFDLRVLTPRLELRLPTDDELIELAALATAGIHDPAAMPFEHPWTDLPPGALERGLFQWNWRGRAEWTSDNWRLSLAVFVGGTVVGAQDVLAREFAVRRAVVTGSWLGRTHQGHGIGKEMRAAVLHLAFAGLDAEWAESAAFLDNPASIAVSRASGYEENGLGVEARRGALAVQQRFVMSRPRWMSNRRDDITIDGLDSCRSMFGV
jgi:RimJ/RimL family protein N-acetyltransferase